MKRKGPNSKKNFKILIMILTLLLIVFSIATIAIIDTLAKRESPSSNTELTENANNTTSQEDKQDSSNQSTNEKASESREKEEEQKQEETQTKPASQAQAQTNINIYSYQGYSIKESQASSAKISFWFGRNTSFTRPNAALTADKFKQYNSYYIGLNQKVIYLTFDEGNLNSQANKNLDTLNKYGIKATFFLTENFIKSNKELVKRMVNEGHLIGNHTVNHKDMATLAAQDPQSFIKEIADTETAFKNTTGKNMDKLFRFPEGVFSEKALDYMNQMGYRSIFWSFAYKDWDPSWNTRAEALSWMKGYYHPGAIYLIHGANVADAEALDEFISYMKSIGYTFSTPDKI